jgi:hypothetical protein
MARNLDHNSSAGGSLIPATNDVDQPSDENKDPNDLRLLLPCLIRILGEFYRLERKEMKLCEALRCSSLFDSKKFPPSYDKTHLQTEFLTRRRVLALMRRDEELSYIINKLLLVREVRSDIEPLLGKALGSVIDHPKQREDPSILGPLLLVRTFLNSRSHGQQVLDAISAARVQCELLVRDKRIALTPPQRRGPKPIDEKYDQDIRKQFDHLKSDRGIRTVDEFCKITSEKNPGKVRKSLQRTRAKKSRTRIARENG